LGSLHSVAIKTNGTLWTWGVNWFGQLGDGTNIDKNTPTQIGNANNWNSIGAGTYHSIAIKDDGSLWAWGQNSYNQLGDGTNIDNDTPIQIGNAYNWLTIDSQIYHTVALQTNGTLWAWGYNYHGQLGDGTNIDKNTPTQIGNFSYWQSISAGFSHTVALQTDGTLWTWGYNHHGQLGDGTTTSRNTPTQTGSDNNWIAISAGSYHTMGLKSIDITPPTALCQNITVTLNDNGTATISADDIDNGSYDNAAITSMTIDKSSFDCSDVGENVVTLTVTDNSENTATCEATVTVVNFSSSKNIFAWGRNNYGQLGDGTSSNRYSPVQIGSASDWVSVSSGGYHSLAIKSDGALWTCGRNDYGQLGDGTTSNRYSPLQIGTASDWALVSGGFYHSLAIKSDGTLWAWGYNDYGQLGDGTTSNRLSPVQIGIETNWSSLSSGNWHSLAIKSDGTLWAWGRNDYGQLGDGTTSNRYSPVQIGTSSDWAFVSNGSGHHSLAIKNDGTLWAWGYNYYGQLGNGTTNNISSPVQIGVATNWASVSNGDLNSFAIKSDGTLWAWGYNSYGALGDGTTTHRYAPVQIGTGSNWASVSSGGYHLLAIKNDGTLWTCGNNWFGQLGDGTSTDSYSLIQIGVASNWAFVSGGFYNSIAFQAVENQLPVAICKDITVYLDDNGIATISIEDIDDGSYSEAGIKSIDIDRTSFDCSDIGDNTVNLTITDIFCNTSSCQSTITVVDNIPPTITVSVSPTTLWPPNNQMKTITATVTVDDNCGDVTYVLTSITSNEDITNDVANATIGTDDLLFDLRAKRNGNGNGRIYTITYTTTDASGNTAIGTATVTVPHHNKSSQTDGSEYNAIVNFQCYPNPFTDETTIEFTLPEQSAVTIKVYNLQGNLVNTLHDGMTSAGLQMLKLNTQNFPAGEYTIVLTFGSEQFIHKVMKEK
jgi:alpha-tubulin suppressor-like RCC1 family protein